KQAQVFQAIGRRRDQNLVQRPGYHPVRRDKTAQQQAGYAVLIIFRIMRAQAGNPDGRSDAAGSNSAGGQNARKQNEGSVQQHVQAHAARQESLERGGKQQGRRAERRPVPGLHRAALSPVTLADTSSSKPAASPISTMRASRPSGVTTW